MSDGSFSHTKAPSFHIPRACGGSAEQSEAEGVLPGATSRGLGHSSIFTYRSFTTLCPQAGIGIERKMQNHSIGPEKPHRKRANPEEFALVILIVNQIITDADASR